MERHPDAQLIFHQDSDTLVDWRQALPRFLRRIFPDLPPEAQDLRSLGLVRMSFYLKHIGLEHLQRNVDLSENRVPRNRFVNHAC